MLRLLIVFGCIVCGFGMALTSAFRSLTFYTWNAYFRPDGWVWNPAPILALKLSKVAGAMTLIGVAFSKDRKIFNFRVFVLGLFMLWAWISSVKAPIQGLNDAYTIENFLRGGLMTYCLIVLLSDGAKLRTWLVVFALSLGIEQVKQGYTDLILRPGGANLNEIACLGTRNTVGVGMLMLTPVLVSLAQTAKKDWHRYAFYFCAFGIFYRGISTHSRGAVLAAVAMLGCYWLRSTNKFRNFCLIVVAVAAVIPLMPEEWRDRIIGISRVEEENEVSALSRFHFWKVAVLMATDKPVFGVGFNAYDANYNRYDFENGLYGENRSVHSSWLGVLAETGYVGASFYFLTLLLAFRACRKIQRLGRKDSRYENHAKFGVAVETALVTCFVGGAFTIFQYQEILLNFIGLSIALHRLATDDIPLTGVDEEVPVVSLDQDAIESSAAGRSASQTQRRMAEPVG